MTFQSDIHRLTAVGAVDGRYGDKATALAAFFSEKALIHYRLRVEAHWLLHLETALSGHFSLSEPIRLFLKNVSREPAAGAAERVKALERTTNHDVKACEYYLKEELVALGAGPDVLAYIHFACTSEDINNLSYAMMIKEARDEVLLPSFDAILGDLAAKAQAYGALPMLAHTHGQTASPTTLGKELCVFAHRLSKVRQRLGQLALEGKMNGAVGNYNAHLAAFPEVDWPEVSRGFIEERLGLAQNPLTTQIENHDSMVEFTEGVRRANTILIGLCRDIWTYISLGYFQQKTLPGEVGSSTMPHKVNPIDFENAEGNYGIANALAVHYADKLPISRLQRDLTDSTVQRTLGTFLGHTLIAHKSLLKGLSKISPQGAVMLSDLDQAVEVLAEPIQTVLRRYGADDAYERLKDATRGKTITLEALHRLIDESKELPAEVKEGLKKLRPREYVGLATRLVEDFLGRQ